MKKSLVLSALSFAFVSMAHTVQGQDMSLAQQNWKGFYAGVALGSTGSQAQLTISGVEGAKSDQWTPSTTLFAGYQRQVQPNWVIGGEIDITAVTFAPDYETHARDLVVRHGDLFARLGYVYNDYMLYAKAGPTLSLYDSQDLDASTTASGFSWGLGVDWAVDDHIFFGADYTKRNLTGSGTADDTDFDISDEGGAFVLRMGYRF